MGPGRRVVVALVTAGCVHGWPKAGGMYGGVYLASARSHVPNNLFGSDLGIGNNGWNPPPIEHTLLLPVRVPACGGLALGQIHA